MRNKKGMLNTVIIHLILVALILAIFVFAVAGKINGRDVKQQVLEKEIALLIDSGQPGMSFSINKVNINGVVNNIVLRDGRVYVDIENLGSFNGYPYFSVHSVFIEEKSDKFIVRIG